MKLQLQNGVKTKKKGSYNLRAISARAHIVFVNYSYLQFCVNGLLGIVAVIPVNMNKHI